MKKDMKTLTLGSGEKLSLTNSGELELFFIGVGSAFAHRHFQTNLLIIKGSEHVMVDFGMTAPRALKETAGLEVTDITNYLITHSHADHVGGLECAGLTNRYVGRPFMKKPKLRMVIAEGYQEVLWDRSLRGGMEWNEEDQVNHRRLSFGDYFDPIRPKWVRQNPREAFDVSIGDIKIELFRTKHVPDNAGDWQSAFTSFGLFLDGHVFVSMDTQFDSELIAEYADRSDFMFHDVQFFPGAVHAPLADLQTLPADVKAKMLLMHYADNWETQDITGFAGWTKQGVRYLFS